MIFSFIDHPLVHTLITYTYATPANVIKRIFCSSTRFHTQVYQKLTTQETVYQKRN